ncbi:hypothetical protein VRRI112168_09460 [Vreelandella rituensis]|uniref:Uncharacterized protein n=1 Tax=Vreelandella rituensis TaxID=2282306 RepID=A0A368U874_9GAMM|nr:hypothetical protein [Halomonas rituensis]RCV93310.1 hypothetical protein DU506_03055 [Halomonas rituensis]
MTIYGTLIVLMYALAPFVWWLMAGITFLIALHIIAYLRGYQLTQYRCYPALVIAALIGLSSLLWIPWLTHSQLSYIATVFDWVALIGAMVGVFVLAFLALHPLSYLVRERG